MRHRTQLYLDDSQYRWLKRRAREEGSIAAVIRNLIDSTRSRNQSAARDPLISYLTDEPPAQGPSDTTVQTLDRDLYG